MKIVRNAALGLFILCLPVLLLGATIRIASNNAEFYYYGFDKYNVSQTTGLEPAELRNVAAGLISYFNGPEEYINLTVTRDGEPFVLFNEREVGHLKDVKELFRLNLNILIGTAIYIFAFGLGLSLLKSTRLLSRGFIGGGILTLALICVLGVMIAADFNWFFHQFHLISFANDLWLLNPATDYLIMLFPQGFWYDAALFCTLGTAFLAAILLLSGWWRIRREKKA